MPYNNLPFLGLNDEKYVHHGQPPPPARREANHGRPPEWVNFPAPALRMIRRLVRALVSWRRSWTASGHSLSELEEREFNLRTHYVNSRRGL